MSNTPGAETERGAAAGGGTAPPLLLHTGELGTRERYQLLTSLVVPRPIAWVSTRSPEGARNLAPFSYFAAVSPSPFLVSISIGERRGEPKDTLRNIRATGAFCVNIATETQLAAMNQTSGEWGADVDEFQHAGLDAAPAETVDAPYVATCPAVLECSLYREIPLPGAFNALILGEVRLVRLAAGLELVPGTHFVATESLRPVGRLWGEHYSFVGDTPTLPRPAG